MSLLTALALLPFTHAASLPWVPCASTGQVWDAGACVASDPEGGLLGLANDLADGHNTVLEADAAANKDGRAALDDGRAFDAAGASALCADDAESAEIVALAEEQFDALFDSGFDASKAVSTLVADLVADGSISERLAVEVVQLVDDATAGRLSDEGVVDRVDSELAAGDWDSGDSAFVRSVQAVGHASHDYWAEVALMGTGPGGGPSASVADGAAAVDSAMSAAATKECEKHFSSIDRCAKVGAIVGAKASKAYTLEMADPSYPDSKPAARRARQVTELVQLGKATYTLRVSGESAKAELVDADGVVVDTRSVDPEADLGDPYATTDGVVTVPIWTAGGWLVLPLTVSDRPAFAR